MKSLLLLIGLLIFINCSGQKQDNIWYFGTHAGLDFNSGTPVKLESGMLDSFEGAASISSTEGELLFYTDGVTVYDASHNVMLNGEGLWGSAHSTQSAIIIPIPGSSSHYLIFTLDYAYSDGRFAYSEVDMSKNTGLGEVVSKNNFIQTGCTEKITAIMHKNLHDIWIIIHERDNDVFKSFLIDASGFHNTAIISSTGPVITGPQGYLKTSSNGNMLAMAIYHQQSAEIFSFDHSTGIVSYSFGFTYPDATYGVEFSRDNSMLYVTVSYDLKQIYQINIANRTSVLIATPAMAPAALQLGPDGKIYVARYDRPDTGSSYLGVINSPELQGTDCNYVDEAIFLGSGMSKMGLPTFIQYDTCSISADFTYKSNWKQVQFTDSSLNATSWLWDFGDGDTSTVQNPLHTYIQDGIYEVCLHVKNECGQNTNCDTISICHNPISNYTYSTQKNLLVGFKNLSSFADSLLWDFGDDQISYEQNPVHTYSQEGTYEVCLKAINTCGEDIHCSSITVCNEPDSKFGYYNYNYLNIAFVDSSLYASGWFWDFGDGTNSIEQNPIHKYTREGAYKVCQIVTNLCGQSVSCDSIYVLSPKQYCFSTTIDNLSVEFTCLLDDFENIKWDFGDGEISAFRNPVHSYNDYGNYEIKISGYKISGYKSGIPFVDRDTLELLNKNQSIGNLIKTSIQPNPTNGLFDIAFYNFVSSDNKIVQLIVSNSFGSAVLFENNYSITSDNELVPLNLSALENGLYFIQIRSHNGSWTNKVIINRN
jgi:PKD repeat protein